MSHAIWRIGFVVAVVGVGCGGAAKKLKTQAVSDMGCSEDQLTLTRVDNYVERVSGCGHDNVYLYEHQTERWVSPIERASFELDCPKEKLRAQPIDNRSVGVQGCSRKAVYALDQTLIQQGMGMVIQYSWVTNSITDPPSKEAAPATEEAAPVTEEAETDEAATDEAAPVEPETE